MNAVSERTRRGLEILGAAVALGLGGDLLLRATPWGLNALLCVAGLIAAVWWIASRRGARASADAPWLAVVALLLGSNFAARDSDALRAFDAIGLSIVASLACLSLRGVALRGRHTCEYLRAGVATAASACVGAFALLGRDVTWSELPNGGALRHARAAGVGTLLAFPLLLVFGGLFASADAVFGKMVNSVLDVDFPALVSHTVLIGTLTAFTAGYLREAVLGRGPGPGAPTGHGSSLGIVPIATALALLDLLFLAFVVIQLRYFFGGTELIQGTTGLTYAEYARRGFFELVTASALVLPVLVGADWTLRNEPRDHQRWFGRLSAGLLVLLGIIMASALQRMRLYVDEFGLSQIRLYSTAFMVYLAGVVAWFGWTVLRGRRRRFAFGALVQGFAVLAGLHLLNPDAFIVRTNLARPPGHRPFDAAYAASLSGDAVPYLLAAFPRLDDREKCRTAAALLRRWTGDADWRNWNLSRAWARRVVHEQEASLRAVPCKDAVAR